MAHKLLWLGFSVGVREGSGAVVTPLGWGKASWVWIATGVGVREITAGLGPDMGVEVGVAVEVGV